MELRRKRHTFIENSYPNSLMTHLLISVSYSRAIILVPDFIIAYPQKLAHKDTKHCLSTVTSHRFFIDKVNILLFLLSMRCLPMKNEKIPALCTGIRLCQGGGIATFLPNDIIYISPILRM